MLCHVHNNLLSPYDSAGMAMYEAMDTIDDESRNPNPNGSIHTVVGDDLERWILKAFIGGAYSGNVLVSTGHSTEDHHPIRLSMKDRLHPLPLLEILYRGADFPAGQGLFYLPAAPGRTVTSDHLVLKPAPIISMDGRNVGAYSVHFFGFEFTLLMDGLAPGVGHPFSIAAYRPAGFEVLGCTTKIQFKWRDGPQSPVVTFLRVSH
jgi:hypothetical protein